MKKIVFTLIAVALFATFCSCQKEGVYKPGKQIANIEYVSSLGGQSMSMGSETWTWDGKKLARIDHHSYIDGKVDGSQEFIYEGKRLSQVEDKINKEKIVYTYDGKYLVKADFYRNDKSEATIDITHDGKQIVAVTVTGVASTKSLCPLTGIIPQEMIPQVKKDIEQSKEMAPKGSNVTTYELTWDGKNLAGFVSINGGIRNTYSYTYDNQRNPLMGMLSIYGDVTSSEYSSRNNVLTTKRILELGYTTPTETSTKYEYTYDKDGKYPIECKYDETEAGVTRTQKIIYTYND